MKRYYKILDIFPVLLSWLWVSTLADGRIRAQAGSTPSLIPALALAMAVSALTRSGVGVGGSGAGV